MLLFISQLNLKAIPETCILNVTQNVQEILDTAVGCLESKIVFKKEHYNDGSLNEGTFFEAQELSKSLKNTCKKSGTGTEYSQSN